ncbi:hypothetical protein BGY98DRAFT_693588 [Russula aff. rugulosa BPL654]|nr:hypothetical protein BGY98DRAFT_693588 [Russula aff. rugulosa BPL654]
MCLIHGSYPGRATSTSCMGEKLLTFLMRRLYMDRSVYGYHVLASAMDTTRLCLTLTALDLIRCSTNLRVQKMFQSQSTLLLCWFRTRTIILSLGTYPASLLHVNCTGSSLLLTGLQIQKSLSTSEQFHRICQTTHHIIIPMDFFVDLFTITSNTPEAEPAPSAPVDAAGGTGGCIVA